MTPNDLITITQAAALRRESGSPLSRDSIYKAIKAGKIKTFTLPVTGARLLVSQAEIEAYQPTGHKPKGYKHERTAGCGGDEGKTMTEDRGESNETH